MIFTEPTALCDRCGAYETYTGRDGPDGWSKTKGKDLCNNCQLAWEDLWDRFLSEFLSQGPPS